MNKIDDILTRLRGQQPVIDNPDMLTDRIMDSLPDIGEEQPKRKRSIRIYAVAAITAAAVMLLLFALRDRPEPPINTPVTAQRTAIPKDSISETKEIPVLPVKQETPKMAKTVETKPKQTARRTQTRVVAKKETSATDSLDFYIDKIERELAQVDESLYIERMNKVIRADERLQRIVNSYILHNLDKEGRPQTADNFDNVTPEQNEE